MRFTGSFFTDLTKAIANSIGMAVDTVKTVTKKLTPKEREYYFAILAYSAAAGFGELARQTPVLTGRSREAFVHHMEYCLAQARAVVSGRTRAKCERAIREYIQSVDTSMTGSKAAPHSDAFNAPNKYRERFAARASAFGGGDDINLMFSSPSSVIAYMNMDMLNDVGAWYLTAYDEGSVNKQNHEAFHFFPKKNYAVGPWELMEDFVRIFNEAFHTLTVALNVFYYADVTNSRTHVSIEVMQ